MSPPNEPTAAVHDKPNPIVEWLWQPTREKELKVRPEVSDGATSELLRRARLTLAIANRLLETPEPFEDGDPAPAARQLYAESVFFALLARERASGEKRDTFAFEPSSRESLKELWNAAETGLVQDAAGGSEAKETCWALLERGAFDDAPTGVDREGLKTLRQFVEALVRTVDGPRSDFENLALSRLIRVGVPALVLLLAAVALGTWPRLRPMAGDTAIPWQTSSTYEAEPGCTSPSQSCDNPNFFFCTNEEENPWIEFDLGAKGRVARVDIVNRTDTSSVMPRAVPLVIEVSNDRQNWKPVARRDETFERWSASFAPTTTRWLRVRASRRTYLHLREVRIHR
jgi:hypothetical protein